MQVIKVRNVNAAFPAALELLRATGVRRESRNGPVLMSPVPVTTVYKKPNERVIFWPERDANPFYHLYEALWMLAGRNDVAPLTRYAKNAANYSDDGMTWHGAYGYRWRKWFSIISQAESFTWKDQLQVIIKNLKENPEDRRSVLQMWDAETDLGRQGKDLPCNLICTFQRGIEGELNLTVFCRSNDIIWGCYGANAVHFSLLLEYVALGIGCSVGTYSQVSVNWHAYQNELFEKVKVISDRVEDDPYGADQPKVIPVPMAGDGDLKRIDNSIQFLLSEADTGFQGGWFDKASRSNWAATVYFTLKAHHSYKEREKLWKVEGFGPSLDAGLETLAQAPIQNADWIVAAREWFERRKARG